MGITYYALDFGADEKLNVGEQIPGYGVYDDYTYFEDGVWTVSNVTSTKVILAGSPGNVATLTYIDALTLSIDAIIEGETITGNFTSITLFE